jgi:predicted RecB family nuclease
VVSAPESPAGIATPPRPAVVRAPLRLGMAAAGRCRRRVHLDHDPDADRSRQRTPDAGLQLRLDTLAGHRAAVRDRLAGILTLTEGWSPAEAARPAALWSVRLASGPRMAVVDLLLRMPDGGYVPVLIRGHRTTDPGSGALLTDLAAWPADGFALPMRSDPRKKARSHHRDVLALAHVRRLLEDLGLASGERCGGIIGFGGPSADAGWDDGAVIVWHRLDVSNGNGNPLEDYDERFADRLAVALAAAERRAALARPSRVSECRTCPWWPVCGPELEAAHDVSLLAAGGDVDILREAGAASYDDVAAMDPAVVAALPLTGIPASEARVRARALLARVPMVRRAERVDVVRADVEFDVDMESYLDDGAYLWGTLLTGEQLPGFDPGYRPFVSWTPLEDVGTATNFVAFWRYLTELRAACAEHGYTFAAYCYSHKAEERWLYGTPARFPEAPGMPSRGEIAAFCASPQWVDLYQEVKRLYIVPGSLRLKAVAPVAGFAWRDPEPGGENSMAWYRAAVSGSGEAATDDARIHRQRILDYNEDDVRATYVLRQWISQQPDAMPTAASLA